MKRHTQRIKASKAKFDRRLIGRRKEEIALLCDAGARARAKAEGRPLPHRRVSQFQRYMELAKKYGIWEA